MSDHYRKGDIEVIDFIRDQLTFEEYIGFCKGNILKYVPRSNHKGGAEDAKKAQDYNTYWIEALEDLEAQGQLNKDIRDVELLEAENAKLKEEVAGVQREYAKMKEKVEELPSLVRVNNKLILQENNFLKKENSGLSKKVAKLQSELDDKEIPQMLDILTVAFGSEQAANLYETSDKGVSILIHYLNGTALTNE